MTETGWICPRCSRVYAPTTPECHACNDALTVRRSLGERIMPDGPATTRAAYMAEAMRPVCNHPGCNKPSVKMEGPEKPGLRFRCEDHAKDDPKGAWDEK